MVTNVGRLANARRGQLVAVAVALAALVSLVAVWATSGDDGNQAQAVAPRALGPSPAPTASSPTPSETERSTPTPTPDPAENFQLAPFPTLTPVPTPRFVSPINGLPRETDQSRRRILAVKIDNAPAARPQSGINEADMMVEIWVEGITRFLSFWQSSDSSFVGPIRSMRPTDYSVQNALATTFVNSGGQPWVQAIGNASNVAWFQEPPGTFRIGSRFAPHNLYGDTNALRGLDGRGNYAEPLEPLWHFGELPADAPEATSIFTAWPFGFGVGWTWNGSAYERTTSGAAHHAIDADGVSRRITAETIVMLEMSIYTASGATGSSVPASATTGSGTAWVFADGRALRGTWSRDSELEWFMLSLPDGSPMPVPPGRLWLVLPQPGGVSYS